MHHWGCKPLQERHVWAELQLKWSGGEHQVRLHLHFTAKAAEAQNLKKQAVWVRMHLQGRRGRERVAQIGKFANFLNILGASQKLIARKLVLIILAPRKK